MSMNHGYLDFLTHKVLALPSSVETVGNGKRSWRRDLSCAFVGFLCNHLILLLALHQNVFHGISMPSVLLPDLIAVLVSGETAAVVKLYFRWVAVSAC